MSSVSSSSWKNYESSSRFFAIHLGQYTTGYGTKVIQTDAAWNKSTNVSGFAWVTQDEPYTQLCCGASYGMFYMAQSVHQEMIWALQHIFQHPTFHTDCSNLVLALQDIKMAYDLVFWIIRQIRLLTKNLLVVF